MINQHLDLPLDKIRALSEQYPVRRLSLFGSILRDNFNDESDVDVLVEFLPNAPVTFLDMARMQRELEELVGREVHLNTPNSLSPHFVEKVLRSAALVYERK